jgi:hypothetical protein
MGFNEDDHGIYNDGDLKVIFYGFTGAHLICFYVWK